MGNVGGMRQVADTSRKRQSTERAGGDSWDREKSRAIQKVPCGEESGGDAEREKSGGRRKLRPEKAPRKEQEAEAAPARRRSRWRKVVQGHLWGTEVAIIVSFAISVLLFLSNFGLCGFVGSFLRSTLLGVFGVMGYLVPFLLFMGTCFYLSNRGNQKAVAKLVAVGEVLLAFCGLSQLLMGGGQHLDWNLGDYYAQAGGGGFIGGILMLLLCGTVGTIGAVLILLVLFGTRCCVHYGAFPGKLR